MQILHPFTGSIREYSDAISDPGHHRPDSCCCPNKFRL